MLLTLISMLGGGLMRLLPEIFNLFNKKTDNSHELAMLDRQIQLEQLKADAAKEVAKTQAASAENIATIQAQAVLDEVQQKAQADALAAQFQMLAEHFQSSGNKIVDSFVLLTRNFVDVLSMLVRPATT